MRLYKSRKEAVEQTSLSMQFFVKSVRLRCQVHLILNEKQTVIIQYSVPVWLVQTLITEYGEDRAEKILQSLHTRNKASVRVTDSKQVNRLARELGADVSKLSPLVW